MASVINDTPHPFGGCDRLLGHYKTIGSELLAFETSSGSFRRFFHLDYPQFYKDLFHVQTDPAVKLRHGLTFISVEVIESYRDDLLNIAVLERDLFIEREGKRVGIAQLGLAGVCLALAFGCFVAAEHLPPLLALGFTVFGAAPFAVLWYMAPTDGAARRLFFAKALSHEINRRRGDRGDRRFATTTMLGKMLGARQLPSGLASRVRAQESAFAAIIEH